MLLVKMHEQMLLKNSFRGNELDPSLPRMKLNITQTPLAWRTPHADRENVSALPNPKGAHFGFILAQSYACMCVCPHEQYL